jgi:hypothetical protein
MMLSETIVSSQLDLDYNRRGKLSPRQLEKLIRQEVFLHCLTFIFLCMGLIFVLAAVIDVRPPFMERYCLILFAMPLFAFVVRSYRYAFSFAEVVEKVQGVLDKVVDASDPDSGSLWQMRVRPHTFITTDSAVAAGLQENEEYIFYFALHRKTKVLLAWERLT